MIQRIERNFDQQIEDTILFESNDFIITPCISPLIHGHVIITSKLHFRNLSTMENKSINDLKEIIMNIRNKFPYYSDCLVLEHGAFDVYNKGGACIIHTHLHLLPQNNKFIKLLDDFFLFKSIKLLSLNEIKKVKYPYILILSDDNMKIYNSESSPSQLIRRIYCDSMGVPEKWDWRQNHNIEYNIKTIEMWKNIIL